MEQLLEIEETDETIALPITKELILTHCARLGGGGIASFS
jgi:hypothetical protein